MNMIRIRSAEIVKHIAPHVTFVDPKLKAPYLEDVAQRLIQAPDTILLLAAFENDEIKAFIVAENTAPRIPFVHLSQVWSHPDNPRDWYKPFLAKLLLWADAHDKDYVRAETMRNTEAMYRRFGFTPSHDVAYAKIIRFDLNNSSEEFFKWATSSHQT
jgi:hypothetical protein